MKKVLIIEDDESTRHQLARILHYEGFGVTESKNGREGLVAALRDLPDLIICDIMMPELDGFGVLRALQEEPRTRSIPFIFLTAKVESRDLRQGMELGADDYLTKPYEPDALIASVRRRLRKRSQVAEESRRQQQEVSLTVAAQLPREICESIEYISTVMNLAALKYAEQVPEIHEIQNAVVQGTSRLQRLARRLNLFSQLPQLYARRFELVRPGTACPVSPLVERTARAMARHWKREADLELGLAGFTLPLKDDYLQLLVEELVDNACKFSPPQTPIQFQGKEHAGHYALEITNQGDGLATDQIERIGAFQQFWRGENRPRGLGLGLALAQGVARLHGGEFALESTPGRICVSIMIPTEGVEACS